MVALGKGIVVTAPIIVDDILSKNNECRRNERRKPWLTSVRVVKEMVSYGVLILKIGLLVRFVTELAMRSRHNLVNLGKFKTSQLTGSNF